MHAYRRAHAISHVFISYVHDNSEVIQRLSASLEAHGVNVWLDRNDIKPGSLWKSANRDAIREGAFFIACFSREYHDRPKTYMNEELTLAIEELRQRPTDRAWFIPHSTGFSGRECQPLADILQT
jgi:TIR domain